MRRSSWHSLALCGLIISSCAAAEGADPAAPKWGPHIDFEAKPGSRRSLGEADLFMPVAQDSRTLLFANLRTRFATNDSREGNLGLGVRRMLESGWNLGAYAYFDRRRSELGNYFSQGTFGLEALGRDFDLRANGYATIGTRAHDIGTVSNASLSGASIQVSTDFREERALSGFDAEAGWRLPLFDSEAARQLRVYLGGYRFTGAGINVHGPRARAEFAVHELPWFSGRAALFVGAETQHDDVRGTQNFAYLRLRIPLGGEHAAATRPTTQERRMADPVVRDVDIVTGSRTRATLNETANVTANGQAITVISSGSTTGAALPGAITAAGANSTVVLAGSFNITATTTLQAGQTVMGTGNLAVRTPSGYVATLAAPGASINDFGGLNNPAVLMGNNSTLTGMTVNSTNGATNAIAVRALGASGVVITNNTIIANQTAGGGTAHGIDIVLGSNNAIVSGNTVTSSVAGGVGGVALALQVNTATNATVINNSLSASGGTPNNAVSLTDAGIAAGSTGNKKVAGTCRLAGVNAGQVVFTDGSTCP